jgi:hypothetical protein
MNTRFFSVAGVAIVLAALLTGCGPSKEQLQMKAEYSAVLQALDTYAQIRQAPNGDAAMKSYDKLEAGLRAAFLDFRAISVTNDELQKTIADKYFADAKWQLAAMRNSKTGPEEAQKARAEFYRTQKLSGRGLVAFGVTAKAVDGFVAAAHRRAALANAPEVARKPPAKKKALAVHRPPAKKRAIKRT